MTQARAIVSEIKELQSSMSYGEQERQNLMQVKRKLSEWERGGLQCGTSTCKCTSIVGEVKALFV